MSILKVFNNQLSEFLDDLITLFPNDVDLKASRVAVNALKKVNPKSLLTNWKYYVTDKYKKQILEGDIDFFLTKNYENDITDVEDKGAAMEAINRLKPALRKIGEANKLKASKYLINLTKLSELY